MSRAAPSPRTPTTEVLHDVVRLACRAPSMHNTQPWAWRIDGAALELYADHSRGTPAADPAGRHVLIACGAALHHAEVAASALGWAPTVHRFPRDEDPDLVARIELGPAARPDPAEADDAVDPALMLEALLARRTDRRQFTSWQVPPERLQHLAAAAAPRGAQAVPVVDEASRHRVEQLLAEAAEQQAGDHALQAEQGRWLDRSAADGVPRETVPRLVPGSASHRSRFGAGWLPQPGREPESWDAVLVLATEQDHRDSWLRSGESLSALWLEAVRNGLAVLPLSQVVEVPRTRRALQRELLGGTAVAQLVVRVGWPSTTLPPLPPTPRRSVEEVLRS